MATGDLSRSAFYPAKRFAGVRMQQGRVLTDDDYNEGARIAEESGRRTLGDVVGPYGSPDEGFRISNVRVVGGRIDFDIREGSFYVGGLRLERPTRESFRLQSDWLRMPDVSAPAAERFDLVYLESWQQTVSAVEDDELFEVALGGPDTATRLRNMSRVRIRPNVGTEECSGAWQQLAAELGSLGPDHVLTPDCRLRVTFAQTGTSSDLCSPEAVGGYLGAENQAIRVQLRNAQTFTWGFDNGAPLYRVTLGQDRRTITFQTEPRDQDHWPRAGQIVELLPWSAVLANGEKLAEELEPGHLSRVATGYDPDSGQLTLATAASAGFGSEWTARSDQADLLRTRFGLEGPQQPYFFLRVWDRGSDLASDPALALTPAPVALGNTGVQITVSGADRLPGDHWIIAARPASRGRVTPWELETGRSPHGYRRRYAPLAVIRWTGQGASISGSAVRDCRNPFRPLIEVEPCCSLVARPGPGWESVFNRIGAGQSAEICLPAGDYPLSTRVVLAGKGHLTLKGSGRGSRILAASGETALRFESCAGVTVHDLYAEALRAGAGSRTDREHLNGVLTFDACGDVRLERLAVRCGAALRREVACLRVSNPFAAANLTAVPAADGSVTVRDCELRIGHQQVGLLLVNAGRARVADNRLLADPDSQRFELARTLQDRAARTALRGALLSSPRIVAADAGAPRTGGARVRIGGRDVSFRTDPSLTGFWQTLVEAAPPAAGATDNQILAHLNGLADRLLLGGGRLAGIDSFRPWVRAIEQADPVCASQGITVGGRIARDLSITGNSVEGAMQGIHVGLSHQAPRTGAAADRAGRVNVADNHLQVFFVLGATRDRHGIFVGNCDSLEVRDNFLRARRFAGTSGLTVEAIRIFGHLGRMIQVRANHCVGFDTGITIQPRGAAVATPQWLAADNLTAGASLPIDAPGSVRRSGNLS